jgi:hypothetical protein
MVWPATGRQGHPSFAETRAGDVQNYTWAG